MNITKFDFFCSACNEIRATRFLYTKSHIKIVQCLTCGLGKACVDEFDSKAYYDKNYFNGNRSDGYANYISAREVLHDQFQRDLQLLDKFGASGGDLLELGCAYGYFLEVANKSYRVSGLEICEEAVNDCHSRGLSNVRHGAISADSMAQFSFFDTIVILDVIEHLPEPRIALELAASKLKSGGKILLTTGDFSSLVARVMGKNWRLMTPPQHLWYFTPCSIAKIGNDLGLEIIHIDHPSKKVPVGLMLYQLCRELSLPPSFPNWLHRVGLRVNLFDAMRVVLRKKDK